MSLGSPLPLLLALTLLVTPTSALSDPPPTTAAPLTLERPAAPWRARPVASTRHMPAPGMGLSDLSRWPQEPKQPSPVTVKAFARALRTICAPGLYRKRARRYAKWVLEVSREFSVDPFLLGALAYRYSRCNPLMRRGHRGGLVTLGWRPHARFIRKRVYHYWELSEGVWVPRVLSLKRYPYRPTTLRRSRSSLYFAAAILRIYSRQCPAIDTRFGSVPHRHAVSHLVWGDRVQDAGSEDRILEARRRLIRYYKARPPDPVGTLDDLPLYLPLDGAPRKVSSGLGDIRGGGHHAHRGLDFESTRGEPVRAIAAGVVYKAGVDLPRGGSRSVAPKKSRHLRRSRMGRGGLFVMIRHHRRLLSAYMHLESFVVRDGQRVEGGQLIGYVGRSGIKRDPAHLHFEIRRDHKPVDPIPLFGAAVSPPDASFRGALIRANQPRMWRRARYRRWMHRKKQRKTRRSR